MLGARFIKAISPNDILKKSLFNGSSQYLTLSDGDTI